VVLQYIINPGKAMAPPEKHEPAIKKRPEKFGAFFNPAD